MTTLDELIKYLKNPVLEKDLNQNFLYRCKLFISLLVISLSISFFISIINGILTSLNIIGDNKHITDDFLKDTSGLELLFFAAVLAPIVEELIFRAPLTLFKQKKIFRIAFYTISIVFAYVHIFNFEINKNVLLFSPLLVAPQFLVGLIFGFIRIRLGLFWAISLHSCYNAILILLFLFASYGTS